MNKELLKLRPGRFLCPYCRKWHTIEYDQWELGDLDNTYIKANLKCTNISKSSSIPNTSNYSIYFDNYYCYYSISGICERANMNIKGKIPISSISESTIFAITDIRFDIEFTSENDVGKYDCKDCSFGNFRKICICPKLGDMGDYRHIKIQLGFEFFRDNYEKILNSVQTKSTLNSSSKQPVQKDTKEITTRNNLFNTEFGPNTDKNIASTIMGVAVNNGETWRLYDKAKHQLTDIGNLKLGNFPMFVLPTIKLSEGDLIKDESGEYYYIIKELENGYAETLVAKTGEVKTVMPIKNLLGFSCYAKVIAISDYFDITGGFDDDMMKIMFMSSIMSRNNMAKFPNSVMSYFIFYTFMKNKK